MVRVRQPQAQGFLGFQGFGEGDGEDFVPAVQIPAHIEFGDFGSLTLRKAYLAATADGPNNGISDCQVCHSNPFGSYKKTVEVPTSDGSGMETLELDFLENLGFGLGPRSMPSPPTNNEPPRPNPNTYGCNSVDEQEETLKRLAKVACDIPGAKSEKERRALALAYACTQDTNKTQR